MKKEETFANSTVQWTTLAHNGVLLPPEYTPLPHSVHFIYDGQPIQLDLEAEEAATLYAVHCVGTGLHTKNPVSIILPLPSLYFLNFQHADVPKELFR